jgi:hypothetical protein
VPLQSASRPAGGAWQPPIQIPMSAVGERPVGDVRVGVDAQGNTVAVWVREAFGTGAAMVQGASRPAGAMWQPFAISADGQHIDDLDVAIDGHGDAVALWSRAGVQGGGVQSSLRPAGGAWQPPTAVSAPDQSTRGGDVEIDAQGNAVAVWDRLAPDLSRVVQSAVRVAGEGWQAPVDLSAAGRNAGGARVAVNARGDAIAVWATSNETEHVLQSAVYDSTPAPPPPPPPPPPSARPTITGLHLSHRSFRAVRSGPPVLPASARAATRVSYTLNTPAGVRFTIRRTRGGRTVGGRCVKPTSGNRRRAICARSVPVRGSFTRHRPAGGDRFVFTGHLAHRTLAPGNYVLVASPTAGGRTGTPARVRFRVVR